MAVNHNFKEGIDWVADGTGETPFSNHVFVSKSGNDSTGTGTPQNPYLTIQAAMNTMANGQTLIIGAGLWLESNLTKASITIIGDGYVLARGNGNNTWHNSFASVKNITFLLWGNIFGSRSSQMENCYIINSSYVIGGATSNINNTNNIYVNAFVEQFWSGTYTERNSILINSTIRTGSNCRLEISNCFVDSDSIVTNGSDGNGLIEFSAINGVYSNFTTETDNIFNIEPSFNNVKGFDLSVDGSSELIGAGENGVNIGGVSIGKGYFQGFNLLDTGIDANSNLAYNSLGEIEIQAGGGDVQTFETTEEEALELSVLGAINISGFPDLSISTPDNDNTLTNPNQLILEINVALLDGIYTGWKKYQWNQQPTQNADGTPNGESSYDWSDNNKVPYKKRKFRITVRNDYNQA